MFENKNEDSGELPDLPVRNFSLKDDFSEEEDSEGHALPSFPNSPTHNNFSQRAIKEAVSNENNIFPKVIEMKEWTPEENAKPELPELPEMEERILKPLNAFPNVIGVERNLSSQFENKSSISPNVFVKIEKFHSARRALAEVQDKLLEIDELMNGIKEIKQKEEQELNAWEQELTQIKARIGSVAENIFEKVK